MRKALLILLLTPLFAMADGYLVLGTTAIDTDITDHTGVMAGVGIKANDFLAVEATALVSSSEEYYDGVALSFNYFYNASVIGSIPVSDSLSFYGKAGYSSGEVEGSYRGYTVTASDTSASYGFGVKYDLMEAWSIRAEFNRAFEDIDTVAIYLQANF